MADFPMLPFWTDAYLADTRHLTTIEHGAYLLLLMEAWRHPRCSLPNDEKILARLCGLTLQEFQPIKLRIMSFWTLNETSGEWFQKRLLKERGYVAATRAKRSESARKRWGKNSKVVPLKPKPKV